MAMPTGDSLNPHAPFFNLQNTELDGTRQALDEGLTPM
jgi:hypothetical protein